MDMRKAALSVTAIATVFGGSALATSSFNRINFDLNSAVLRPDAVAILHEGAELMKNYPEIKARIEGSACSSELGANTLWFERASAARTFLVQHGVNPAQITAISNANPAWETKMRRIYNDVECSEEVRAVMFVDARTSH